MLIGYARVSTDEQTVDLQIDALKQAGCERIFQDSGVSGWRAQRPALDEALSLLQTGDTLVTWRLDRLGRSLSQLICLVGRLEEDGIAFRSLCEAIDTATAAGRLLFHVMGALAEFERALISERTKAGIAAARTRGAAIGRPTKLSPAQIASASALLNRRPMHDVARTYGVSPPTLRRAIGTKNHRSG